MHVLHTPAKQELLRFLSTHPGSTTANVAAAFRITSEAARQRIAELEEAGVVDASVEAGQRRGRVVTFTTNPTRVRELIEALASYVLGE